MANPKIGVVGLTFGDRSLNFVSRAIAADLYVVRWWSTCRLGPCLCSRGRARCLLRPEPTWVASTMDGRTDGWPRLRA